MKDRVLKYQARVLDALAHPLRLKIVKKLRSGPCCVCKIYAFVRSEQSNVSHHLAILKRAGIVSSQRRGQWMWYRVADPHLFRLIDQLCACARGQLKRVRPVRGKTGKKAR